MNVVIGIVKKDNKILMIKRAKEEGNLVWAFPGGKVEEAETLEDACIREVFEETGITVEIEKLLGERIHPNTNVKLTYFLCAYKKGNPSISNKDEICEIQYKDKEEFERDVKTDIFPPIKDYIKKYIK